MNDKRRDYEGDVFYEAWRRGLNPDAAVRACAEAAQNADIACHRDYQRSDDGGGTLANARNDILKLLRPDSLLTPPRDPQ